RAPLLARPSETPCADGPRVRPEIHRWWHRYEPAARSSTVSSRGARRAHIHTTAPRVQTPAVRGGEGSGAAFRCKSGPGQVQESGPGLTNYDANRGAASSRIWIVGAC